MHRTAPHGLESPSHSIASVGAGKPCLEGQEPMRYLQLLTCVVASFLLICVCLLAGRAPADWTISFRTLMCVMGLRAGWWVRPEHLTE